MSTAVFSHLPLSFVHVSYFVFIAFSIAQRSHFNTVRLTHSLEFISSLARLLTPPFVDCRLTVLHTLGWSVLTLNICVGIKNRFRSIKLLMSENEFCVCCACAYYSLPHFMLSPSPLENGKKMRDKQRQKVHTTHTHSTDQYDLRKPKEDDVSPREGTFLSGCNLYIGTAARALVCRDQLRNETNTHTRASCDT